MDRRLKVEKVRPRDMRQCMICDRSIGHNEYVHLGTLGLV